MDTMHAAQVLEFDLVRAQLAGYCETELGGGEARRLEPSFDPDQFWALQELTQEAYQLMGVHSLPFLGAVGDMRDSLQRAQRGGTMDGESLVRLADALAAMRSLKTLVKAHSGDYPRLWRLAEVLPELPSLEEKLYRSLDGSGEVKDDASSELLRLRKQRASRAQKILERIQSYTSGKTRELLSDPIYTQREGRYVIPLKSENKSKIKGVVHDTSASGQTVFIEPEEIVQLGNELRIAEAAERAEVARILAELSERAGNHADEIVPGLDATSDIDLALAKARMGYQMGAVSPIQAKEFCIRIVDGRHPLLEKDLAIPLRIEIGWEFLGVLITGPNTGGKTVAIKTVGLFALMAQCGLMLPATEVRFGGFSQIWADIGDEQSLQQSLSTFSAHIKNIAQAMANLKPGALVLLDEIGAGTDPAEGASLAKAILLAFRERGARILASTHYGELKVFAYNTEGFTNAAMEFDLKSLKPTYRLLMGAPGASHALKIAERYGIQKPIVDAAREGLGIEEQDVARMLEKLEIAQRQAQKAQGEADRLTARLKQVEAEAQRKLDEASQAKREARSKAAESLEAALREIRLEAAEIFEELKANRNSDSVEQARIQLKRLQEAGAAAGRELRPEEQRTPTDVPITKGMPVKISGYTQTGTTLSDPKEGKVQVQLGMMKMYVSVSDVRPTAAATSPKAAPRKNLGLQKMQYATTELHLRMMRAEEAERTLAKFIDDAILAGLPSVRIVHGKGEGILRKITHDFLRRHKGIRSFREAEPAEGGQGATVAILD